MAITFGPAGAPSQETRNFDSLFTLSLSNYQKQLFDNISTSNAFLTKLMRSGSWIGIDGGTDVKFPLMYALGEADTFSGYDVLPVNPINGHTQSIWEWRECAIPITVSHRELRQNAQNIEPLVSAKMEQAEIGFKEFIAKLTLQGNAPLGGSVVDPRVSPSNGSLGFVPLPSLVRVDPTTSASIGNINQSTETWWRNQTKSSTASSYEAFLKELQGIYNDCSKGPGGPPDMALCDQYTYQMIERMLVNRAGSRLPNSTDASFPFENIKWKRTMFTWDEFVPDPVADTATVEVDSATGGVCYFLNTKYIKFFYDTGTNFIQSDWASAPNQPNARTKHIMFMGNTAITNRRKHGILYGIDTTISS